MIGSMSTFLHPVWHNLDARVSCQRRRTLRYLLYLIICDKGQRAEGWPCIEYVYTAQFNHLAAFLTQDRTRRLSTSADRLSLDSNHRSLVKANLLEHVRALRSGTKPRPPYLTKSLAVLPSKEPSPLRSGLVPHQFASLERGGMIEG